MSEDSHKSISDKLKGTSLFADKGEVAAAAIRTVFRELNDEKAIAGINIHLIEDDQSKIGTIQFYFED